MPFYLRGAMFWLAARIFNYSLCGASLLSTGFHITFSVKNATKIHFSSIYYTMDSLSRNIQSNILSTYNNITGHSRVIESALTIPNKIPYEHYAP